MSVRNYVLGLSCAVLLLAVGSAQNAKIGNCSLTGKRGEFPIRPAVTGQLTVHVSLPAPIFWNGDTPETIKDGLEYCLAANVAHRAGYTRLKVVNVSFDAIVAGQGRNYDLALSQISITEPRKKVVDFSPSYFSSDIGVLIKKGAAITATNIRSKVLGVVTSTTGQYFVAEVLKASNVKVFQDTTSAFTALQAGQVDAAITDTSIVVGQAKASKGLFEVVGQYATGDQYGAIYPKNSPNRSNLDKIFNALIQEGVVLKLTEQFFGFDPKTIPYFKP